jgi:hypothetical protein
MGEEVSFEPEEVTGYIVRFLGTSEAMKYF